MSILDNLTLKINIDLTVLTIQQLKDLACKYKRAKQKGAGEVIRQILLELKDRTYENDVNYSDVIKFEQQLITSRRKKAA